jgi:hypothetical protein
MLAGPLRVFKHVTSHDTIPRCCGVGLKVNIPLKKKNWATHRCLKQTLAVVVIKYFIARADI